jgi:5-formyltetrahydrofolate cyclo-ligase
MSSGDSAHEDNSMLRQGDLKKAIRQAVLARRDALPAAARTRASAVIQHKIVNLPAYRSARTVLGYMNFGSEFESARFVRAVLNDGKILVLPKINRAARKLDLYRVHDLERDLAAGVWGIKEPRSERCAPHTSQQIDFVLAPGVAFDEKGERLGYGGGYYDRLLHSLGKHPVLAAAAFSVQIVDQVPVEANDRAVDLVVTENAEYGRLRRSHHTG